MLVPVALVLLMAPALLADAGSQGTLWDNRAPRSGPQANPWSRRVLRAGGSWSRRVLRSDGPEDKLSTYGEFSSSFLFKIFFLPLQECLQMRMDGKEQICQEVRPSKDAA